MKTKKDKLTALMQDTFWSIENVLDMFDPMHTSCKANAGMEDEYSDVIDVLYRMFQDETRNIREFTRDDIIDALSECFGYDLVKDVCNFEMIDECTRKINRYLEVFFDELKRIEYSD
jgi:hypothetical protein